MKKQATVSITLSINTEINLPRKKEYTQEQLMKLFLKQHPMNAINCINDYKDTISKELKCPHTEEMKAHLKNVKKELAYVIDDYAVNIND